MALIVQFLRSTFGIVLFKCFLLFFSQYGWANVLRTKIMWDVRPNHMWDVGPNHMWDVGPNRMWDVGPNHMWDVGPNHMWDVGPTHMWDVGPNHMWDVGPNQMWDALLEILPPESDSTDGSLPTSLEIIFEKLAVLPLTWLCLMVTTLLWFHDKACSTLTFRPQTKFPVVDATVIRT